MTALVPADDLEAGVAKGATLVDPAPQAEAVAMRQHHGGEVLRAVSSDRAHRSRGGILGMREVDLHVQRHPVVGQHDVFLVGHDLEQLRCLESRHRGSVSRGAVSRETGRGRCRHPDRSGRDAEHGVAAQPWAHERPCEPPVTMRGTRAPMRVTIS